MKNHKVMIIHPFCMNVEVRLVPDKYCPNEDIYFMRDTGETGYLVINRLEGEVSKLKRLLKKEKERSNNRLEGLRYFQAKRKGII